MFGKEMTYSCMARLAGADGLWTNFPTTDLSRAQNRKCKWFYGQSFSSCRVIRRLWKHFIQLGTQKGLKWGHLHEWGVTGAARVSTTQLMACVWAWKEEESWEMLIVWGNEIQQRLLNAPSEVSAARAGGPASKPRHWKEKTSCLAFALHSLFHLQIAPIYICPRNHLTLPQTERDFEWVPVLCWNTKLEKITGNSRAKTVSKKHRAKSALCS